MKSRGQQEIAGFVLIVGVVMIGMMVFLVISLKGGSESENSLEVEHMLDALMKHTTECAIVYEPDYDNFEDLFKSCHQGDQCSNLDRSACDYLNESLRAIIGDMMKSEAAIGFYQLDFSVKEEDGQRGLLQIIEGNCTGNVNGAQRSIVSYSDSLIIRMKVCVKS